MKRTLLGIPLAVLTASYMVKVAERIVGHKIRCADCRTADNVRAYHGGEVFLCESCMNTRLEKSLEAWQYHPEHLRLTAERQMYGYIFIGMILFVTLIVSSCLSEVFGPIGFLPLGLVLAGFAYGFARIYYEQHIKPSPWKWLKKAAGNVAYYLLIMLMIALAIDIISGKGIPAAMSRLIMLVLGVEGQ